MADLPFHVARRGFRFAGGLRVEDSDQIVNSPVAADDPTIQTAQIDETDLLPSANLTCEVTAASNLRLGYYKSVNRPEFRELANVVYLDFDANQNVIGNPDLERAIIRNYDVRLEWFPRQSEVLAFSWFYKDLDDAIEEELLPAPDRYVRTWFNSPSGKNYGYELELRKSLGFAWGSLDNLIVQANYTHVDSEVEYVEEYTDAQGNAHSETKQRPLQGQAPYTLNTGLIYSMPDIGLSMSLLYNRFGRRLDAVGDTREEDIYEESRELLDFAMTEQFGDWMRLKFTIKDILAQDAVYTFGSTGSTWESIQAGTTYALSLSFSL
jgi:TonB-dependent receptor